LWQLGDFGEDDEALQRAVDALERIRLELGLDADSAQQAMARAFAAVLS
jgi:hypothetical protein